MSIFWRLIKLTFPLKGWVALAVLLGFCTVGSGVGLMATSSYLISSAALHPSIAALNVAIVGVRFFGISRGVFRYLERYVSHYVTFSLLARLRVWFYRSIEPLAPARLQGYRSGDLLSRIVADIETLENFYVRVLAPPLVAAVVALVMWFFLGAYDFAFAVIFLAFYLLAGIGVPLLAHLTGNKIGKELIKARADLNQGVLEGVQGIADIVAFGQEQPQLDHVNSLNRRLIGLQQKQAWLGGMQGALSNLLVNLALWVMLLVAIPQVRDGRLDGIYLALLVLATVSSFESVLALPLAFQHLGSSLEAARRLYELVDTEPPVVESPEPFPAPCSFDVEMRQVSFSYNPGDPPVLKNISFSMPEGHCTAVVGPSGAGKSTIANLLLRFWDYHDGEITLGGMPLKGYNPDEVREKIAYVSQNTHIFNTTIKENLLLARPGAEMEEIFEAARKAQIHDFIMSLPHGYDTETGEQGIRLSGGERQRLAIARALLKNSPILILDEPTANLDTLTEREVIKAIYTLMEGRTTLLITHRMVGLEKADEILVLKDGAIIERGQHYELLQLEGAYWKMNEMQNQILIP